MDVGRTILDGNADAVEFCPHDSFYNVLAGSTYVLQEGDCPSRSGSITLFDVDADSSRLELIQKVETAGIFDIKWSPVHLQRLAQPMLAQADADGCLKIYSLQGSDSDNWKTRGPHLNEIFKKRISSSMCLCVDWNLPATSMAVGLSDGSVSIVSLDESGPNTLQQWKAHDFEVWAASFDTQCPTLVYTGSDDCKFSCWDLRCDPSNMVFQNTKAHKMGVCCIAKSPFDPNTVLTGSYDEHLRVWDVRQALRPVNDSSICLGGGVWRIKHHPYEKGLVLAACMHNGFAIVRFEGEKVEVVETYEKHGSLAYGVDWQRGGRGLRPVVATCSFYDRVIRVWRPERDVYAYYRKEQCGDIH